MEWINVKTRLPEQDTRVLIAAGRFLTMADWNAQAQRFELTTREDAAIIPSQDITHWMPLPELPKERHNDPDAPLLLCDGVTVESRLGAVPVEYSGKADHQEYYFRARGEQWEMTIGDSVDACVDASLSARPLDQAEFYCTGRYGNTRFAAGYMPLEHAEAIIRHCVRLWRAAQAQE